MLFTPHQGLLAIALFEAGAIVILLVLYLLFQRDFHARFFRFWVAGWTLYTVFGLSQILEFWQSSLLRRLLTHEFFFAGSLLLVAAVLEYTGRSRWLALLWPIAALGAMLFLAAVVFGWIAIGAEVGQRMAEVFKWKMHPAASAALGTFVLTLVLGVIGIIPCIGWLGSALVGAIGLGAVVVTRFGMRQYGEAPAAPPAPVASA